MQIVIELSDEEYARIQSLAWEWKHADDWFDTLTKAVHYGTPLHKDHGRLLDECDVIKSLFDYIHGKRTIGECIDRVKEVIPADKEDEECKN